MFDQFKSRMSRQGSYMGQVLKNQSDVIMDATFTNDVAYRKCYIQDKGTIFPEQTLAGYKKAKAVFAGIEGYDMDELTGFSPIDTKYIVNKSYNITGDNIDYQLQFRPMVHHNNPNIRVGALIFIPDDIGVYNLWMIVARDDQPQFVKWYVLRVNLLLKWFIGHTEVPHYEGHHVDTGSYFSWAVQRTQSSYNSGVWTDYTVTTPENQKIAIFPTNQDTNTITYNERFTIGNNPIRRLSWEVTKLDDSAIPGITRITFAQQPEHDPIDNISWVNITSENYSDLETGIDYDYYCPRSNDVKYHTPVSPENEVPLGSITYSGVKPSVKVGGSYKTFTANLKNVTKPCWSIDYVSDSATVCTVNLSYTGNELICEDRRDTFVIADNNKISYYQDGKQIFGIQFKYNPEKPMELKIKCQSILSMIGNKMVVKSGPSLPNMLSSLEVEVESL